MDDYLRSVKQILELSASFADGSLSKASSPIGRKNIGECSTKPIGISAGGLMRHKMARFSPFCGGGAFLLAESWVGS
jgi:hypothetical protein